jgi:hypothetical protein
MGTIAENIRTKMVAASIGGEETATAWPIHIGLIPSSPDACIVITHAPGRAPDPKYLIDYPAFQIRIRGPQGKYKDAELKAQRIKDYFLGFTSEDVDGVRWISITMLSDMAFIGADENNRPHFVVNLQMIVEMPQTADNTNREPV